MVVFHDRVANRSDALKEVFGVGFIGAGKGLDEDDLGGRLRMGVVEALDADRHGWLFAVRKICGLTESISKT